MALIVVVCPEKEWKKYEDGFEAVRRLMPIKMVVAHKSVDGVGKVQRAGAACTACFLYKTFSAPGKEEYSDTLRKYLKEKTPDLPVVAFGSNKASAGKEGDNFHVWMEVSGDEPDPKAVAKIVQGIQAGEITAGGGTLRRSMEGQRRSLDGGAAPARRSIDGGARPLGRTSMNAAAAYGAAEAAAAPARRMSIGERPGTPNDMSMVMSPMASPRMMPTSPLPSQRASLDVRMSPTALQGAMQAQRMSMDSRIPGGMMMSSMMAMPGSLSPMMGATGGVMGVPGGYLMGSGGSFSAGVGAPLKSMASLSMSPAGFDGYSAGGIPAAPAAPVAAPAGASGELVKALAEEVVRLRKAVEEKRARQATASPAQ